MTCVSYTRTMSCSLMDKPTSDIIAIQNDHIAEFALAHEWKIEKKYSDRKQDRNADSAFSVLKEDGISGKFDLVVFDSIYRFGCTVLHAYDLLALVFLPADIHFAVVEDSFCSSDHSKEEVLEYLDNKRSDYRKLHSQETTGRKLENRVYEKYGYCHKDGEMKLVIDEEVADNIRSIFNLVAEGNSFKQVAKIMNERGVEPPQLYMKRKGSNYNYSNETVWLATQVRNIVKNRLYIGEWVRTVNCKKVTFPCPAIVDSNVFDQVTERHLVQGKSPSRWTKSFNPLCGIFTDYDSGWAIMQYRKQGKYADERIYRLKYPKPESINYESMLIPYEVVEQEILEFLCREQKMANLAVHMLETAECERIREERERPIRKQAQAVFENMKQCEYQAWQTNKPIAEITEVQQRNNAELQMYLSQIDEIEFFLSAENPWIKLYSNMKLPTKLTSTFTKKYIASATCEKFVKIRMKPKEKDAFMQLPQEWFREE